MRNKSKNRGIRYPDLIYAGNKIDMLLYFDESTFTSNIPIEVHSIEGRECKVIIFDIENLKRVELESKVRMSFDIGSLFENEDEYSASCCEYKQYFKADASKNGKPITEANYGLTLDSNEFVEDVYGRNYLNIEGKSERETYDDEYGWYSGNDMPGFVNPKIGDNIEMDVDFKGYIRDICRDNIQVSDTISWGFKIKGVYPNTTIDIKDITRRRQP